MSRVVIIGAGIAGASTAAALARRGHAVTLVEKEAVAGTGSTGRNAAIFRLAVAEPENVELAIRAREIGRRLVPAGTVTPTGAYYRCADERELQAIVGASGHAGVRAVASAEVPRPLRRGEHVVFSPDDGVIDVHALVQALLREATSGGATLRFETRVRELDRAAGRVVGVVTDRERLPADVVVDATGPWSPAIAAESDVGIRPHRRHLFVLDTEHAPAIDTVLWDLADGFYLRPESGGLLASACDELALAATDVVPTDPEVAAILFEKLSKADPALAGARVRRWWAGLRPLTADHRFVVGPDPRVDGLFRVGGFGGHGMTAGAAAGEIAAALLSGEQPAIARALDPARAFARHA